MVIFEKHFHFKPFNYVNFQLPTSNFQLPTSNIFLILFFCLLLGNSQAQTSECGTPDRTALEIQQLRDNFPPNISGGISNSPWQIPVYFFHLKYSNGDDIYPDFNIEDALLTVNLHFEGLFTFYVCGSTEILDDQFAELDLVVDRDDLHSYVNSNFQPQVNHCVKIFLAQGAIFVGQDNNAGVADDRILYEENGAIYLGGTDYRTISHELGHYFGLPHTFGGGNQYVHDANTPVLINGISYTCFQTGDGFCDTPAHLNTCNETMLPSGECIAGSCDPAVDPLGVPFAPDASLLMSCFGVCRERFSSEQKVFMSAIFQTHSNYLPLRELNGVCGIHTGRVIRDCYTINQNLPDPMTELSVGVKSIAGPICVDVTNSVGRYENNPCNFPNNQKRSVLPDLDYRDDQLNGVETDDLVLIQEHILGISSLDGPLKQIAADANYSGSVTNSDVVAIRKTILTGGQVPLPYSSWRYIPNIALNTQAFWNQLNDGNPFDATYPDPFASFGNDRTYLNPGNLMPNNTSWMDHVNVVPTDPLANFENTWSLTGIKVGDVNCTAGSIDMEEGPSLETPVNPGNPIISLNLNQQKVIGVQIAAEEPIMAWQLGLKTINSQIEILDVLPGDPATPFDPENFDLANIANAAGGQKLSALWFSNNATAASVDQTTLFAMELKGNSTVTDLNNLFKLSPQILEAKFFNSNLEEVEVSLTLVEKTGLRSYIKPSKPAGLKVVSVVPNPFQDEFVVTVDLDTPAPLKISLMNAQGDLVYTQWFELSVGIHDLQIGGFESLGAGLLFYSIETGSGKQTGKLIKL